MNSNLTTERPTFVTHLECAMVGDRYEADQIHNLSKAGKPLLVRYDLAGVKKAMTKDALKQRPDGLWKWRELLPVRKAQDIVSLGEDATPLIWLPKMAKKLGGGEIIVKDEGRLPTGSFKARGLVMAVSMAKALGIRHMAMPTNGNAGAALAAYASRCGIRTQFSQYPISIQKWHRNITDNKIRLLLKRLIYTRYSIRSAESLIILKGEPLEDFFAQDGFIFND